VVKDFAVPGLLQKRQKMLSSYEDMKDVAIAAARQATIILMERFGDVRRVASKNMVYRELVTDVDLQVEGEIITVIRDEYPDHSILSEERGELHRRSEYKWIVDPLDGTHNYARKLPMFGVSIALEHKGMVVLGVISLPYFDELYTAERGKGAYRNDKKLQVSDVGLSESLMIYDTKLRVNKEPMIGYLSDLVHKVFIIRMYGCATWDLCLVAKGQAEFAVDFTSKPWDMAAGALMVEEAGGRVTDLQGNTWNAYTQGYIASNGKVHEQILGIMEVG
jgi:myo-inositol-1(or 4)-monophosphatase